jgi:hypothetical protein
MVNNMRTKKPKHFQLSGRFDISILIEAKDKHEALAYAQQEFPNLVVVDTNELNGVMLMNKTTVKIKTPKRYKESDGK